MPARRRLWVEWLMPDALGNSITLPSDFENERLIILPTIAKDFKTKASVPILTGSFIHDHLHYHEMKKVIESIQKKIVKSQNALEKALGEKCP